MTNEMSEKQERELLLDGMEALQLMEKALEMLDVCDPQGTITPHLDLAIARLRARLDLGTSGRRS